jgi:hypothetical protein
MLAKAAFSYEASTDLSSMFIVRFRLASVLLLMLFGGLLAFCV